MNYDKDEEGSQTDLLKKNDKSHNINQSDTGSVKEDQKKRRNRIIKIALIILLIIGVILAIVLPLTLKSKDDHNDSPVPPPPTPPSPPVPDNYNPYSLDKKNIQTDNQATFSGYLSSSETYNPQKHQSAFNKLFKSSEATKDKLGVESKKIPQGQNNPFIKNIQFNFEMMNQKVARLEMTDKDNKRFSIPENILPRPGYDLSMRLEMNGFNYNLNPFSFKFQDPVDPKNVFLTTENQTMVFMDKFIQIDFLLPSQRIFGFGERVHDFQLGEGTWTMWANGQDQKVDDGEGRRGTYGVHPFVLVQGKNKGDFFGLYFRNSNAQSPIIKYNDNGQSVLSYISIGGQLEVYFILHGSVKQVMGAYQSLLGNSINLPPFWSLGWQQASQKYKDQASVKAMLSKYSENKIPLDAVYLDSSYLLADANFQVDKKAFDDLPGLYTIMKDNQEKLILSVDASIVAESPDDSYYKKGKGLYIQSNKDGKGASGDLINLKPNGKKAVFIDWYNDQCLPFWQDAIQQIYTQVSFDGLWLDMNEPVTQKPGEISNPSSTVHRKLLQGENSDEDYTWYGTFDQDKYGQSTFYLPFVPQYHDQPNQYGNFDNITLSLNATYPSNKQTEYDLHNLYGHMSAKRTYEVLNSAKAPGSLNNYRTFILSRGNFLSSGKYASHSLGQNIRSWEFMKQSIAGIVSMNAFGITQVGADVCGYSGKKLDQEMCARWIQLSTFYPLARSNQNDKNGDDVDENQEPYNLKDKYFTMALSSIQDRYQYLRHMYTCMYEVSTSSGSCFDPLFYYYPEDDNLFGDTSSSFMVGGAIKVTPVLISQVDSSQFQAYFPKGQWVNLANPAEILGNNDAGSIHVLNANQNTVNAHLRPGTWIPWQDYKVTQAKTTNDLLNFPISIVANRDQNGNAKGSLVLNRGQIQDESSVYFQFSLQSNSLIAQQGRQNDYQDPAMTFQDLRILNAKDLENTDFACVQDFDMKITLLDKPNYDSQIAVLTLAPLKGTKVQFSQIRHLYFGNSKTDINLCSDDTFKYKVKGDAPKLDQRSAQFTITPYSAALQELQVTLNINTDYMLNIKWNYANKPAAYVAPFEVPKNVIGDNPTKDTQYKLSQLVKVNQDPFQLIIMDPKGNQLLSIDNLLLDQYLNVIKTTVTTMKGQDFKGIFGLGERANHDFFYKDGIYSLWTRDIPTPIEDGKPPGKNMYGTHPLYMHKRDIGNWIGVFYRLAQAQDWIVKNDATNGLINLQTYSTGGIGDITLMMGTKPDEIVSAYWEIVGKPVVVPQWSLGWHQCRYGYDNTQQLIDVVNGYKQNSIPLDVQWSDIDYLSAYKDFTYDDSEYRYKDLDVFVSNLNKENKRYIPILDAGIALRPSQNYDAYDQGKDKDIYIKIKENEDLIVQVWPKDAVFPDFFHPDTNQWWKDQLTKFSKKITFSGLWQDMNEASDFCGGLCYQSQQVDSPVKYKLKYLPTGHDLETISMPLDAFHHGGILELDAHSLFGTLQVSASNDWFKENNMRTFIIERSSFAGMGKFGSRWLGDNYSTKEYMGLSVTGVMLMNMFGITMSGSDICGFMSDTTPELCARWHMVGAFYPFSRNHNTMGAISQEPYVDMFQKPYNKAGVTYTQIMTRAINMKYSMIRYYYTQIMLQSLEGKESLYKPLFFEFPEEAGAYENLQYNIMLGQALKLGIQSDTLAQDTTSFYYPKGLWCNIISPDEDPCFLSTGQLIPKDSFAYSFYLSLREGYLVPMQNAQALGIMTSYDLQQNPVDFHILGTITTAPDWSSQGEYFNDDGLQVTFDKNYNRVKIQVQTQLSDPKDKILINFNQVARATCTQPVNDRCPPINQNDLIGNIYIYYAKTYKVSTTTYKVTATLTDEKQQTETVDLGTTTYNTDFDRLELKPQNQQKLLLPYLVKITYSI